MAIFRWITVSIIIYSLARKAVGKSTDAAAKCQSSCNLSKGYCTPDGECSCYEGWKGPNCDQCEPAVGCDHGTCNLPGECNCESNWGGHRCDIDLTFCDKNAPCQNDATCINGASGSFVCICGHGYHGDRCQFSVTTTPAVTSPKMSCQNGGTCRFGNDFAGCEKCACPKGFAGNFCEEVVMMCVTRPCANGGKCHNIIGDFRCECARGFVGRHCNEDVNECEIIQGEVCANGGKCVNKIGSYSCECSQGFEGARCEKLVERIIPTTVAFTAPKSTPKIHKIPVVKPASTVKPSTTRESSVFIEKLKKVSIPKRRPDYQHIIREVKIDAANGKVSVVEQSANQHSSLVISSGKESSSDQASVSVVQAVTFAFLGVAIALFIGIGAFMWTYCSKKRSKYTRGQRDTENEICEVQTSRSDNQVVETSNPSPPPYTKSGRSTHNARLARNQSHTTIVNEITTPPVHLYVSLPKEETNMLPQTSGGLTVRDISQSKTYGY